MQTITDTTRADDEEPFAAGNTFELDGLDLRGRRRWPYLLAGLAIGAAGALGVVTLSSGDGDDVGEADTVAAALVTTDVRVEDLVEEVEWVGDLGFGEPVEVVATAEATVTGATGAGTVLARGDVVFELDNQPVVLFYGPLPLWRDLGEGVEGPDVEQLETNLVALGYDPDTTVTIDDVFTANTAAMVARWQEDIGHEATGEVGQEDVVVAPGPVSVTTEATIGERLRVGVPVASLSARSSTTTVVGAATGTVTGVAEVGVVAEHGAVLYVTDEVTVQAVERLDAVSERLVDPEVDPVELESLLAFLGYDPDDAMVIDSEYDEATVAAVERWQSDVGLTATGDLSPDAYVVVSEGLRVADQLVGVGDEILAPHPVLVLASPTLEVVVPVGLADQDEFSAGQELSVVLPDDSIVAGVVVDVGTVASTLEPGADPLIDVVVELAEAVEDDLLASEVTVIVAGDRVDDAMVVATRGLVTLAEGGFAVEKVLADGSTVLVAVETGAFDDGVVEVESSQLVPGDEIVVPQ